MLKKRLLELLTMSVFLLFALCDGVFGEDFKRGIITAYDTYIAPEEPLKAVNLKAKLEEKWIFNINPDVEDETLSFYVDGQLIAEIKTAEEGFAQTNFLPKQRKNYIFTVKLESRKGREYKADSASATVYAIDPKKPAIIVDIDNTVSQTDASSLIFNGFDNESKPLKDAPEVLTELAKYYNIFFVTAREDAFLQKTKSWLKGWRFPDVPVFFADVGQTSYFSQGNFKAETVSSIQKDVKNVVVGIGDKEHDAKAYIKDGLKAIIIGEDEAPEEAIRVKNWLEIKNELLKEEYLKIK